MKAKQALASFLLYAALIGGVSEYLEFHQIREPLWWRVTSTALGGLILFIWYYFDSESRGYIRSKWLNIGVVAFGLVAVPYYLVRSRPNGQKVRALLYCFGFCILVFMSSAFGSALSVLFG